MTRAELMKKLEADREKAEAETMYKGYTVAELRKTFDEHHGVNWKDPFTTVVHLGDLDRLAKAVWFFHAANITVTVEGHATSMMRVTSPGYQG